MDGRMERCEDESKTRHRLKGNGEGGGLNQVTESCQLLWHKLLCRRAWRIDPSTFSIWCDLFRAHKNVCNVRWCHFPLRNYVYVSWQFLNDQNFERKLLAKQRETATKTFPCWRSVEKLVSPFSFFFFFHSLFFSFSFFTFSYLFQTRWIRHGHSLLWRCWWPLRTRLLW